MDIINVIDIVSLVSTICRCNTAQLIIRAESHYCCRWNSVVCLLVGRSVDLSQSSALQKRLNRSKCRLGCGLR